MPGKQSLYELFGLTDKASPEEIQAAFAQKRAMLDVLPEGEEKHNRIAILIEARDVLLDRRQRAGYDRRQRDRRGSERRHDNLRTPAKKGTGRIGMVFGMLAVGAIAAYIGRQTAPTPEPAVSAAPRAVAAAAVAPPVPPVDRAAEAESIAADGAALLAAIKPASNAAPVSAPRRQAPAEPSQPPLPESPQLATARSIADATFAVVGGGGQGTGVAIAPDKLLTNCHVIAPNVHKGPLLAIHTPTGRATLITHAAFLVREDACVAHAPGLNARPMPMGNAARLLPGATIYSLGFAQGRASFSTGTFLGVINRSGQDYLVSTNYCDFGVSGGPLVDEAGNLIGLTSGGTRDRKLCASLTAETARRVLDQTLIAIDGFPTDYLTNLRRRW